MLYWKCLNGPYQSEKKYRSYARCKQDAETIAKEYDAIVLIYQVGEHVDKCIEAIDLQESIETQGPHNTQDLETIQDE